MKLVRTTPVPNIVFDEFMRDLNMCELKVLLVTIRKTLGWAGNENDRKKRDWISGGQLVQITGISRRATSDALKSLINRGLIKVTNFQGNALENANERRGKTKLYFELSKRVIGDNEFKSGYQLKINKGTSANSAFDVSKKVNELGNKLRITKETLQN